jgi:hypothetical protein
LRQNYIFLTSLLRGSGQDHTVTLAGAEGTGADDVFGIVLDPVIDPSSRATVSVGRSGVYDATQLLVDPSVTLADFADRLRERGIFLEKLQLVGVIGGGSPSGTIWDNGASQRDK